MKIVGLITEYNPFHNAHLYHIEKAKEMTGADAAVVVMSGDFVQRGAPAVMPKHLRTQAALAGGVTDSGYHAHADVVFEIPVAYSIGSAEYFAKGAISLLESLGCVNYICFGSECGNLEALKTIARILADEPFTYKDSLKENLKEGFAFPRARTLALEEYLTEHHTNVSPDSVRAIMAEPNNTLGVEYIKELYKSGSEIEPYTEQRLESDYHDEHLRENYSSASSIRNLMKDDAGLARLEDEVPPESARLILENYGKRDPIWTDDFSLLLKHDLLKETEESLTAYQDVSEELANKIINNRNDFQSITQFGELLKTKDLTRTRVMRALFHILLDTKKENLDTYEEEGRCQYAHLLGFREDAEPVLSQISEHIKVPLLTKLKKTGELSETGLTMLGQDLFAADLYESAITDKFGTPFINEYEQPIVKV